MDSDVDNVTTKLSSGMQQIIRDKDAALLRIRLEDVDESEKLETNENKNVIELFKPSKKKCFTRKKVLDKQVKKLVKNITQKLRYKLRRICINNNIQSLYKSDVSPSDSIYLRILITSTIRSFVNIRISSFF